MDYSDIESTSLRYLAYLFQLLAGIFVLVGVFSLGFQLSVWSISGQWYTLPWLELLTGVAPESMARSGVWEPKFLSNFSWLMELEIFLLSILFALIARLMGIGIVVSQWSKPGAEVEWEPESS